MLILFAKGKQKNRNNLFSLFCPLEIVGKVESFFFLLFNVISGTFFQHGHRNSKLVLGWPLKGLLMMDLPGGNMVKKGFLVPNIQGQTLFPLFSNNGFHLYIRILFVYG